MRTIFFRRPKKQFLLGGLVGIFIFFFFLAQYHTPEKISLPDPVVKRANPFGGNALGDREKIPLAVALNRDRDNKPFQNVEELPRQKPAEFLKDHRGPHQPAAVERHFEAKPDEDKNALNINAQALVDAQQAIHEAVKVDEEQQNANLAIPDNLKEDNDINVVKEKPKLPVNEADDGGIPFHLTPRRPPEMSQSWSTGPGMYFLNSS